LLLFFLISLDGDLKKFLVWGGEEKRIKAKSITIAYFRQAQYRVAMLFANGYQVRTGDLISHFDNSIKVKKRQSSFLALESG